MTDKTTPKLKPCPFCGTQPHYEEFPRRDIASDQHEIACESATCPIRVEVYAASKAEAFNKWNNRAPIGAAKNALSKYGSHLHGCDINRTPSRKGGINKCDCGFTAALQAAQPEE